MADPADNDQPHLARLRASLRTALAIADQTERQLEVAAIIAEALEDLGIHPIVVGGLAVAYWSSGVYLSSDIDVVMPSSPRVDQRMAELGFQRDGRYWVLPESDIVVEAPGGALNSEGDPAYVSLRSGRRLALVRVEALLLDRLEEFVATGHADAFAQSILLLGSRAVDRQLLERQAERRRLAVGLTKLDELASDVASGRTFTAWELHRIADALLRGALE